LNTLLSTAYLPPSIWFAYYIQLGEKVYLERHENFVKQSFRNRCRIHTSQGHLDLSIPLNHSSSKQIERADISYSENWQKNHWRAFQSAYSKAPFFSIIADEMEDIFFQPQITSLWEWNLNWIHWVFKWLEVKSSLSFTVEFEPTPSNCIDLRNAIHPKKGLSLLPKSELVISPLLTEIGSLSIIHLLSYEGSNAYSELSGKNT